MNTLTEQQLIESYEKAKELNLAASFIQLIKNELMRRRTNTKYIN